MFILKNRIVGGFKFRELYPKSFGSLAGHPHLGTDYNAIIGTKLYSPFDGIIKSVLIGAQGGKTIWYKPFNDDVIMRFMHLSEFKCGIGDVVKEGDVIGLTGNTGSASNAPHLHCDISKHKVDIYNIDNFIDPETYQWEIVAHQTLQQTPVSSIVEHTTKIDAVIPQKQTDVSEPTETLKTSPEVKIEQIEHIPEVSNSLDVVQAQESIQSIKNTIPESIESIQTTQVCLHSQEDVSKTIEKEVKEISEFINLIKLIYNFVSKLWTK